MTGILNLTEHDITLIAGSGETTTTEPSGYVARVEYERRTVSGLGISAAQQSDIPIVEQTPREIVIDAPPGGETVEGLGFDTLLLVTREVAEAAAIWRVCQERFMEAPCENRLHNGPHPLASRMVWADNPTNVEVGPYKYSGIIGYRELRRVGGVK